MPACEKCWSDAGGSALRYRELLEQRNESDTPCTPADQCGERHAMGSDGRCACGLFDFAKSSPAVPETMEGA